MNEPWTAELPERLDAATGHPVAVPLTTAHGGYEWVAVSSAPDVVSAEVETGAAPAPGDPPSSGAARQVLQLAPRSAGEAEVELRLTRPWQPQEPLAVHVLRVQVTSPI